MINMLYEFSTDQPMDNVWWYLKKGHLFERQFASILILFGDKLELALGMAWYRIGDQVLSRCTYLSTL